MVKAQECENGEIPQCENGQFATKPIRLIGASYYEFEIKYKRSPDFEYSTENMSRIIMRWKSEKVGLQKIPT